MHTPITIAIVEDDLLIAQFLSEVLSDEGYTVRAYLDGRSGLAAIIAEPPALVLLDLNLPSRTGEEVLVRIRQHLGAAMPVVIMTASTQRQNWVAQGAIWKAFASAFCTPSGKRKGKVAVPAQSASA